MKLRIGLAVIISLLLIGLICPLVSADEDNGSVDLSTTGLLTISDVSASSIGYYGTTISWKTNGDATSQVFYDTISHDNVTDYAHQTIESLSLVLAHSVSLTGLASSTTYHYRVRSEIPGTEFISISEDHTFTTLTPSPGGGGGGGGEPSYTITTDLFGGQGTNPISSTGEVLRTIQGTSSDGNLGVTIPKGTVAKEKDGTRLKSLAINAYENPPEPPAGANIIGLTYNFGPNGATFAPPMTLTWKYDPATLGDVTEESLVLAYYDEAAGKWVELQCVVDTVNHTITARVAHFTVFAIIGTVPPPPPPAPAEFAVSGLVVSPGEVYTGESVSIEVLVVNTGGESGSYEVAFKINGAAVIEAREVTLSPGSSQKVGLTMSRDVPGTYNVDVNGLIGSFTVKEKPEEVVPPGFNWPLVGGLIAAAVVVGLGVFFLIRRRRA